MQLATHTFNLIQFNDALLLLKKVIVVSFILAVFWLISWCIQATISKSLKKIGVDNAPLCLLLVRMIKGVLMLLATLVALGTIGVDVSALVASIGLTGFGLSFALKDMVASAVAGGMLMVYRPFSVGDNIEISGHQGRVKSIDFRYLTLVVNDDQSVLVPNAMVYQSLIQIGKS
jgi:small conductance mechanosensitive channel